MLNHERGIPKTKGKNFLSFLVIFGVAAILLTLILSGGRFPKKTVLDAPPSATSGKRFQIHITVGNQTVKQRHWRKKIVDEGKCTISLIGVVTTIQDEVPILSSFLESYENAHLVVVGDARGPRTLKVKEHLLERAHFLDLSKQDELYPEFSSSLPTNSFSRKNIGYIHALSLGACFLWDFDDDNESSDIFILRKTAENLGNDFNFDAIGLLSADERVLNPYLVYGPRGHVWPRGYPIENTSKRSFPQLFPYNLQNYSVDIVQILQDIDPDLDAIWRLQNKLPLLWQSSEALSGSVLVIHPRKFAPYNAQSTLVTRKAAWSLYLPKTVHGRVSDIWRSFIAQAIMPFTQSVVAFAGPDVQHYRNSHDYLADFAAEQPLYERAGELCQFLELWSDEIKFEEGTDALDALLSLYHKLTTGGIFDGKHSEEVFTIKNWVNALEKINYVAPSMKKITTVKAPSADEELSKLLDKTLMVYHINHQRVENAPLLRALYPEYKSAVFYIPGLKPCIQVSGLTIECISDDFQGLYAYESVVEAWRRDSSYHSYIFSHDDAVVRRQKLKAFMMMNLSIGMHAGRYFGNGTWHWNSMVNRSVDLLSLANEPWVKREFYVGQSDWFLLKSEDMQNLSSSAKLFRKYDMFLEVAVPTLMEWFVPYRFRASLITSWERKKRSNPIQMTKLACKNDGDLVHPIKMSSTVGLRAHFIANSC